MDRKVPRAGPDPQVTRAPSGCWERRGSWVCRGFLGIQDGKAQRDLRASRAFPEPMARRDLGVYPGSWAPGASAAPRDPEARGGHEEPPESWGQRAHLAVTAPTALQGKGDSRAPRGQTASPDPKDPRDPLARTGFLGTLVSEEKSVSKARQARPDLRGW